MFKQDFAPGEVIKDDPLKLKRDTLDILINHQRDLQVEIDKGFEEIKTKIGVTPEEHVERLAKLRTKMGDYEKGQAKKMELIKEIEILGGNNPARSAELEKRFGNTSANEPTGAEISDPDKLTGQNEELLAQRINAIEKKVA